MNPRSGWYSDPSNHTQERWWDGGQWTSSVRSLSATHSGPVPPPPPPLPNPTADIAHGATASDQVHSLMSENQQLRMLVASLQIGEPLRLAHDLTALRSEAAALRTERDRLRSELVEVDEMVTLQEVGIYRTGRPAQDSVALRSQLKVVRSQIDVAAKGGHAVSCLVTWQVNGSSAEGRRMGAEVSKLMLRAYNNEADAIGKALKPHSYPASLVRLERVRETISRLGRTMRIQISEYFHQLRVHELMLIAEYADALSEERGRNRVARERLREEEIVRREIEREQAKLSKERSHYELALARVAAGEESPASIPDLQAKLAAVTEAIQQVEARAANTRAGYVYVISNVGSFGNGVLKVGMTRRLEPLDRVRELGGASVPFRFDVHALVFSNDAVALEQRIHGSLESCRVNRVNARREFFRTTPTEIELLLKQFAGETLVSFVEEPEASEWRRSQIPMRRPPALAPSHSDTR